MSENGFTQKFDEEFYLKGKSYWNEIEPTLDGMLGGFTEVTTVDITASTRFLSNFFDTIEKKNKLNESDVESKQTDNNKTIALDCGAGIGRVSKHLLLKFFDNVDLVEQNQAFLDETKHYIGEDNASRIGRLICCGLQDFIPDSSKKYDCIWVQWVAGHLTDDDYVLFLVRCKSALKQPNGVIVIKDNTTSSDECDLDHKDNSVTRPNWLLIEIFKKAGLSVISERRQYKMPKGLYPVKMFALK